MLLEKYILFLPSSQISRIHRMVSRFETDSSVVNMFIFVWAVHFGEGILFCSFGTGVGEVTVHITSACLVFQEGIDWGMMGNVFGSVCFILFIYYVFVLNGIGY